MDSPARNLTFGLMEVLGRDIAAGRFSGKPFPTEADLTSEHLVSRAVTREALKMLTVKGLVTTRCRTGIAVQPLGRWDLRDRDVLRWLLAKGLSPDLQRDTTALRSAIEPAAAALAAKAGDGDAISAVTAAYERLRAPTASELDRREAAIDFHVGVLAASCNPFYQQLAGFVLAALRASPTGAEVCDTARSAYREVLDAIAGRRPEFARNAMARIIELSGRSTAPTEPGTVNRSPAERLDVTPWGIGALVSLARGAP